MPTLVLVSQFARFTPKMHVICSTMHGQLEEEAAAIFLYQIFPSRRHVRLRSSSPRAPPVMPLLVSVDNATISPILLKGCVSTGDSFIFYFFYKYS